VVETQPEGMQEKAARAEANVARAVSGVTHHRVADRREVHADLVRAPALQRELEQGRRCRSGPSLAHGV
jgi:hypothetical protein